MSNYQELYTIIENQPEIKRLKELEKYIDSKSELRDKINNLLNIQKQMLNTKYIGLVMAHKQYKEEYENLKDELLSYPFVDEYLELLDQAHILIKNVLKIIEDEIEKDF